MNALEAMEEIDGMLFDKLGEKEYTRLMNEFGMILEYRNSGYCDAVFFLEACIYDSDNPNREWGDEGNDYALSLKDHIIQEINKYIDKVQSLRVL